MKIILVKKYKNKPRMKLRAAALLYSIIVSAVLAIFGSALLMSSYSGDLLYEISMRYQKLHANSISGLHLLLDENYSKVSPAVVDLFGNESDSVILSSKQWGAFQLASSTAFSAGESEQLITLLGVKRKNKTALYIADNDRSLSVCGNTLIKGECYLPKSGVKRAYIEGKSFEGKNIVIGLVQNSNKALPFISNKEQIKKINFPPDISDNDSVVIIENGNIPDSIFQSFTKKTIVLRSSSPVYLNKNHFSGNIIITSEHSVTVSSEVTLKDVLIYAPNIYFKEKFTGSLQAFAADTLLVEKECVFEYPTVLSIYNKKHNLNPHTSFIHLCEGTTLTGEIFCIEPSTDVSIQAIISVDKKCKIKGNIYTSGSIDLKGEVLGSVYCNSFFLKTSSSYYENHLLDCTIDVSKRPAHFAGVLALSNNDEEKVFVKWLN